jgi:hypothetical protein
MAHPVSMLLMAPRRKEEAGFDKFIGTVVAE